MEIVENLEDKLSDFHIESLESDTDMAVLDEITEPITRELIDPQLPEQSNNLLNQIIDNHYYKHRIREERLHLIEELRQNLQKQLRLDPKFGEETRIDIFGSLANGLGTMCSDVDFCLRLGDDHLKKNRMIEKDYLRELRSHLECGGCANVSEIFSAKVPIVKFEWNPDAETNIHGDLSYYNVLGMYNSQLIKKYCEWEPERLPKLGVFIKQWAQSCGIGSSSQGSLSSYAYTLMLIHFLQNTEPPVLPNLQKGENSDDALDVEIAHGSYVQFTKTVIPNWSKNTSSVAELLVGFFSFYAEFSFDEKIIHIRGIAEPSKSRKFAKIPIRIEDPFVVATNVGRTAKAKMATFIKKAFSTAHRVLTVDFVEKFPDSHLERCNSTRLTYIEEKLLEMCLAGEVAPIRKIGGGWKEKTTSPKEPREARQPGKKLKKYLEGRFKKRGLIIPEPVPSVNEGDNSATLPENRPEVCSVSPPIVDLPPASQPPPLIAQFQWVPSHMYAQPPPNYYELPPPPLFGMMEIPVGCPPLSFSPIPARNPYLPNEPVANEQQIKIKNEETLANIDSLLQERMNKRIRCAICQEHTKAFRCPQCLNGFCSTCHDNIHKDLETRNTCPCCEKKEIKFTEIISGHNPNR